MRQDYFLIMGLLLVSAAGCQKAGPSVSLCQRLQDSNPDVRVHAIMEAAQTRDERALPYLVDRLDDGRDEVRFFAILALEKITGTDRGYKYYEDPGPRHEAVERWRQWLKERTKNTGMPEPATQPAVVADETGE
ncbi:MAG: HEAT repeat domain-containing protein [Phycisphaerae bacterium]